MAQNKNIGLRAFCKHFLAHAWLSHCYEGDGMEMLNILENDNHLVGGEMFNQNFYLSFDEIYPQELKTNKTWKRLMPTLVEFKGKGLGVGELYLALVINGWTFERTDGKGDGKVAGGIRELKNNGASLKPLAEAIRVQDELNATIFKGNRAGPVTKFEEHRKWILSQPSAEAVYKEYFSKLYPGKNIENMCKQLATAETGNAFNKIIGLEVLNWYKEVDKWNSLVIIDQDKMMIGNIADVNNLEIFKNIKFEWKSERGGDTQAITDGYVNIRI